MNLLNEIKSFEQFMQSKNEITETATVDTNMNGEMGMKDMKKVHTKHKKVSKNISKNIEDIKHDKPVGDMEQIAKHSAKGSQHKMGTTPSHIEKDQTHKQVKKTTA